jgi:hypothetical protein
MAEPFTTSPMARAVVDIRADELLDGIVQFRYYPGWAGWLTQDVGIWPSAMSLGSEHR